ncbi:MAG: alkaline phosphatase family protein [Myxococcales bacterium]|nr:alkaline phosphatase family protein [Myxococcales bacterium]
MRTARRHRLFTLSGALLFLACGALQQGAAEDERLEVSGRVLLLAIDGADWDVINRIVAEGKAPNFAALMRQGTYGVLHSLSPSWSPVIWTSIATGVMPPVHGINNFVYTEGGQRHLYTSGMIKIPTLWEILSDQGISVGVTNYWFTYPALPVQGYMISDHAIPSRSDRLVKTFAKGQDPPPREHLVHPPELWDEIQGLLDPPRLRWGGAGYDKLSIEARFLSMYSMLMEDGLVTDLALAADRIHHPRVTAVYWKGVDRASHAYWRYLEPDHEFYADDPPSEREIGLYEDWIPWVYRHTDALLGEMRQILTPNDIIVITSDHGFEARIPKRGGKVTGGHHQGESKNGIYLMAGAGIAPRGAQGPDIHVTDIAPTILYLVDSPVPAHMTGKVALELLDPRLLAQRQVRQSPALSRDDRLLSAGAESKVVPLEAERIERLEALGYFESDLPTASETDAPGAGEDTTGNEPSSTP